MINLISLKNNEHINIVYKINKYNAPEKIYIPIQYLERNVKINEYIFKNTYFKDYVSSISGTISGMEEINYNNKLIKAVVINNDYKENVKTKSKTIKIDNREDLIKRLNKSLLNKISNLEIIDNLIITSIDEEYYSIKEFMRLSKNYREILDTIDLLTHIFDLNNALLVTKNTNFNSIKNVKSILGTYPNIKITLAPDKYLIGNKDFLCDYLNKDKTKTLVLTVNEIYDIYSILNGKDITETLITISGNTLEKSLLLNVRLGTSLNEIINEYIKILDDDYEVFINGPMQGYKILNNKDIIISKEIDYIVINKKEILEEEECINCGACNKICPNHINVKKCYLKKLNHKKCIGCGLCNYICPANIRLKEIVKSDSIEEE